MRSPYPQGAIQWVCVGAKDELEQSDFLRKFRQVIVIKGSSCRAEAESPDVERSWVGLGGSLRR